MNIARESRFLKEEVISCKEVKGWFSLFLFSFFVKGGRAFVEAFISVGNVYRLTFWKIWSEKTSLKRDGGRASRFTEANFL